MPRLLSTPPSWVHWLNTSVSWATSSASTTIPVSAVCQVSGVTPLNVMVRSGSGQALGHHPSGLWSPRGLVTPGYDMYSSCLLPSSLGSLCCTHVSHFVSPLFKCL